MTTSTSSSLPWSIRAGLEEYGQHQETAGVDDTGRVDQLREVAQVVAEVMGVEVGFAVVPVKDGSGAMRACAIVVPSPAAAEPV